ncbi:hypothetical protein MKW92_028372, partial [Papaver armeniacum]
EDVDDAMSKAPWNIVDHMLVLQVYKSNIQVSDYKFTHQAFPVQIQKLELDHLDDFIIEKMCNEIGRPVYKSHLAGRKKSLGKKKLGLGIIKTDYQGKYALSAMS